MSTTSPTTGAGANYSSISSPFVGDVMKPSTTRQSKPMRWLRLWTDSLDSKKIQRLTPYLFKAWIQILLATARNGSDDGTLPAIEDLCFDLREPRGTVAGWLRELATAGLLDAHHNGTFTAHDWKHWQPRDRTNSARQDAVRKARRGIKPPTDGGD